MDSQPEPQQLANDFTHQERAKSFVVQCSNCRLCEGAAYQSPPVSYTGRISGRVLVIAQNPGEFDPKTDPNRSWWSRAVAAKNAMNDPLMMKTWYEWDFGTSNAAQKLEWLTKYGWLGSGDFCFSNAVRCRTKANGTPQIDMMVNCSQHTKELISMWIEATGSEERRLLVLMGATAKIQFLRLYKDVIFPEWGTAASITGLGTVLPIKHYAAWRGESNKYRQAFKNAYEGLMS